MKKFKEIFDEILQQTMKTMCVHMAEEADVYRNNLKNREFDKEAPQNICPERMTIAVRQGMSEDKNFEAKPTQSKTDFSSCFGIKAREKILEVFHKSL